jgi:hypothetical protein
MLGATETPQKVEVVPESTRTVDMSAQAGIETKSGAFVF